MDMGRKSQDLNSDAVGRGKWNNSVSRLTEVSDDEGREREQSSWMGIRKTTVSTQDAQFS